VRIAPGPPIKIHHGAGRENLDLVDTPADIFEQTRRKGRVQEYDVERIGCRSLQEAQGITMADDCAFCIERSYILFDDIQGMA
jgi:hypothetical protein